MKFKMNQMKLENGKKIKRKELKYEANKYLYDFQQFETIRSFGNSILYW